ncbi:MAG TPA: hypothetical protein VIL90_05580 [Puia sp.]|jgi:hypothetical protein
MTTETEKLERFEGHGGNGTRNRVETVRFDNQPILESVASDSTDFLGVNFRQDMEGNLYTK